jgi:hypothetical protein
MILLQLLLAVALAAADCSFCADARQIACARCEGSGKRAIACARCDGSRSIGCPYCRDGTWNCGACAGTTFIRWKSGETDPCKVCGKKGKFSCAGCRGAKSIGCPDCKKTGKRTVSCSACLGIGRFPCPSCDKAPCVACAGNKRIACSDCGGAGRFPRECEKCLDTGTRFCTSCKSYGFSPCETCHGAGKVRFVYEGSGTKAGTRSCTDCDGRGATRCAGCKTGLAPCDEQAGSTKCDECTGGWRDCALCE